MLSLLGIGGKKDFIYIALEPSASKHPDEKRYHWSFLVGPNPKSPSDPCPGKKYHVTRDESKRWVVEVVDVPDIRVAGEHVLVRVLIGKVEDAEVLDRLLRGIEPVQGNPKWRSNTWVANALRKMALDAEAVNTNASVLDWQKIEVFARGYAIEKEHAGRFAKDHSSEKPKPTWNMLKDKEWVC